VRLTAIAKAAQRLGIGAATLYRKLKQERQ